MSSTASTMGMCSAFDVCKQRGLHARSLSSKVGSVLGMELNMSDNSCTVKKRLKLW